MSERTVLQLSFSCGRVFFLNFTQDSDSGMYVGDEESKRKVEGLRQRRFIIIIIRYLT